MSYLEEKTKRAIRTLGSNYLLAKNCTLDYQKEGSRVLEEFKRKCEREREERMKSKVVSLKRAEG